MIGAAFNPVKSSAGSSFSSFFSSGFLTKNSASAADLEGVLKRCFRSEPPLREPVLEAFLASTT